MASERQAENAVKFYESRAVHYDGTWHDDFTRRFVGYIDIKPGQHVLDLACGTGLLTFLESDAVGPSGTVIGVDVTLSMLDVAKFKQRKAGDKYSNVTFLEGNVLRLEEIEMLKGKTFDVITIASALVLFPDPKAAIEHWSQFLKPGGVLAVDATHPRNLVSGIVLERVARRLDLPIPYNRCWSKTEATLSGMLESAGLECTSVTTIENQAGYGRRFYDLEQWDDFFVENVIVKDVTRIFASNDIRRKAQAIYKEEWEKLAVGGKVEEVDSVFLAVARRPSDGSRYVFEAVEDSVIFKGGCRCGGVSYTSTARPRDIVLCHCRACQQLSGSAYLPFTRVPADSLTFTETSTRKTLRLSEIAERSYCSACGSPITMVYSFNQDEVSLTMSSVDLQSMVYEPPKVSKHMFLREKAPWLILAEDGAERWGTSEDAHLIEHR